MAYLEHIDPGNSGGSVVIPVSPYKYQQEDITYTCHDCGEVFKTEEDRRHHRLEAHLTKRPYLFIKKLAPRKEEVVIRSQLSKIDISFENTDAVELDGTRFINLDEATENLLLKQTGRHELVLTHQSYRHKHQIVFDIAEETSLKQIDDTFYDVFSSSIPLAKKLELFNDKVRTITGNGLSYAGALGCYITGIMAKDRVAENFIEFDKYVAKLGEAQDKLQGIERPLANSINAIIGFMLNDFNLTNGDTNIPPLYFAKEFFNSGIFLNHSESASGNTKIPIDAVTELLVRFCNLKHAYQNANKEALDKAYLSSATSNQDKTKLAFILWVLAKTDIDLKTAKKLRTQLIHSTSFKELVAKLEGTVHE